MLTCGRRDTDYTKHTEHLNVCATTEIILYTIKVDANEQTLRQRPFF